MGKKVVILGEIMFWLFFLGNICFVQLDFFDVVYGGGEVNVVVSCVNYGYDVYFIIKLFGYEIGQLVVNVFCKYGVKIDYIVWGGECVGIYYLEIGVVMCFSKVIYDCVYFVIVEVVVVDFDFDKIMEGVDWFYWFGIIFVILDKVVELIWFVCEVVKCYGVMVLVDLNFCKKLWMKEKVQFIMKFLMKYVDVCIGNEEDVEFCLGFKFDVDVEGGYIDVEGYKGIFWQMMDEFGFSYVILML